MTIKKAATAVCIAGLLAAAALLFPPVRDALANQVTLLRDLYVDDQVTGEILQVDGSSPKRVQAVTHVAPAHGHGTTDPNELSDDTVGTEQLDDSTSPSPGDCVKVASGAGIGGGYELTYGACPIEFVDHVFQIVPYLNNTVVTPVLLKLAIGGPVTNTIAANFIFKGSAVYPASGVSDDFMTWCECYGSSCVGNASLDIYDVSGGAVLATTSWGCTNSSSPPGVAIRNQTTFANIPSAKSGMAVRATVPIRCTVSCDGLGWVRWK